MGVFLCLRIYVFCRFLQTANLITVLKWGRMARMRHSQAAATRLAVCAYVEPQRAARVIGFVHIVMGGYGIHPYTLCFILCVGSLGEGGLRAIRESPLRHLFRLSGAILDKFTNTGVY